LFSLSSLTCYTTGLRELQYLFAVEQREGIWFDQSMFY